MDTEKTDSLNQQVSKTLQDSWLNLFLTDLFQGVGHLALLLLLLEAIWEWDVMFRRPDVYVLSVAALGQSAWLAWRTRKGLALPWWSRLVGMVGYVLVESAIEGGSFFDKPKHATFVVLMLFYAWGAALEAHDKKSWRTLCGVCLSRTSQAIGPLLFYIALDLRDLPWIAGLQGWYASPPHLYLLFLAIAQVGWFISNALLNLRQKGVIDNLAHQLATLSRWGFGSEVVKQVLRNRGAQAASRIERAIGFIDIRGFTAWSEVHQPEQVMAMLNAFYAAVLDSCAADLVMSKTAGDEVLLVLPASAQAVPQMQAALRAAIAAVQPMQLSAGAGLWLGPVVEGFFGAQDAQVHSVIGDTVNTAKRLCDHAKMGKLLVGPTSQLTDGAEEQISISAKGKTEPVTAAVYSV
jgi:class 3 adenylate cyclase